MKWRLLVALAGAGLVAHTSEGALFAAPEPVGQYQTGPQYGGAPSSPDDFDLSGFPPQPTNFKEQQVMEEIRAARNLSRDVTPTTKGHAHERLAKYYDDKGDGQRAAGEYAKAKYWYSGGQSAAPAPAGPAPAGGYPAPVAAPAYPGPPAPSGGYPGPVAAPAYPGPPAPAGGYPGPGPTPAPAPAPAPAGGYPGPVAAPAPAPGPAPAGGYPAPVAAPAYPAQPVGPAPAPAPVQPGAPAPPRRSALDKVQGALRSLAQIGAAAANAQPNPNEWESADLPRPPAATPQEEQLWNSMNSAQTPPDKASAHQALGQYWQSKGQQDKAAREFARAQQWRSVNPQ